MPRKKTGAFAALKKLEADRQALAEREKQARTMAATELGQAVLAANITDLDLAAFRALMRELGRTGIGTAMARLRPTGGADPGPSATVKPASEVTT